MWQTYLCEVGITIYPGLSSNRINVGHVLKVHWRLCTNRIIVGQVYMYTGAYVAIVLLWGRYYNTLGICSIHINVSTY